MKPWIITAIFTIFTLLILNNAVSVKINMILYIPKNKMQIN